MGNRQQRASSGTAPPAWAWALFVAVYVATRLPFLGLGYGLDDDTWLMARAADSLATLGQYEPSRLPGYPTAELGFGLAFLLLGTGWIQGNALAAAIGLAGAAGMYALLDGSNRWLRLLAAAVLVYHPAYWINSVSTIDFTWGAVCMLWAAVALRRDRPFAGGLFLALAVGARLTNCLAVLPLAAFYLLSHRKPGRTVAFGAVAGLGSAALFVLPMAWAGGDFLQYTRALHRDFLIGGYKVYREIVGLPFCLVAGVAVVTWLVRGPVRGRLASLADVLRRPRVVLSVGTLLVLVVPFALLPTDPNYLLGWVPFGIVLLVSLHAGGLLRRRTVAALLGALMVTSVVSFAEIDVDAYRERRAFEIHWVREGRVLQSYAERRERMRRGEAAFRAEFPPDAAVILGSSLYPLQLLRGEPEHALEEKEYLLPETNTLLLRILPAERVESLAAERPVFYAGGENLPYLTRRIFGYSLEELGAREIPIW